MKKRTVLYTIAISLLFVFTLYYYWSVNRVRIRDYQQIEEEGVLRIVTDYNPTTYYVSGDSVTGFNAELIKLLQRYTPLRIEVILKSDLKESVDSIRMAKFDVLARNMPVTSELRNYLNFTESITQNKLVLVQRKPQFNDSIAPIRSHLDLAKKQLHLPANSPAILRIKNLSHEIGDTIYYIEDPLYGAEQLAYKVALKEIDYAVCDENMASHLSKSIPEIDVSTPIGFTQFEAWAVSYNSPVLLDSLNSWIDKIKQTKEFKKLIEKYHK